MNNYNNQGAGGFNRNKGNSPRGNFRERPSFGGGRREGGNKDRNDRTAQMFTATCSSCHKSCEVPFKPSLDKPVYCSSCFSKKNEEEGRDFKSPSREERPRHNADSFSSRKEYVPERNQDLTRDVIKQLTLIENKLNRILDLINPPVPAVKKVEVINNKKEIEKKVVDKKELKEVVEKAISKGAAKKVAKKVLKKVVKKAAKKAK